MTARAKESRPAHAWAFGKRDKPAKTMLDAETLELAHKKARLLGYTTFAEWMADVLTGNVRGADQVATVHAERIRRACETGPVMDQPEGGDAPR